MAELISCYTVLLSQKVFKKKVHNHKRTEKEWKNTIQDEVRSKPICSIHFPPLFSLLFSLRWQRVKENRVNLVKQTLSSLLLLPLPQLEADQSSLRQTKKEREGRQSTQDDYYRAQKKPRVPRIKKYLYEKSNPDVLQAIFHLNTTQNPICHHWVSSTCHHVRPVHYG